MVSYSEGTNHTLTTEQAQAFAKQMKRSTILVEAKKTEPSPVASATIKPSPTPSSTPTPSTSPSPLKK